MEKYLLSVLCFVLTQTFTQQGNIYSNGMGLGKFQFGRRSDHLESSESAEDDPRSEDHSTYSEEISQESPYVTEHQLHSSMDGGGHFITGSDLGGFGQQTNSDYHHQQYSEPEIHEMTKLFPVHQDIRVPVSYRVMTPIHVPVPYRMLEPYHIQIPVPVKVEKTVHVPVEKIVKYPVFKPVPVKVVKKVHVPVAKPYPVPVPVYKLKLVLHSKQYHDE